MHETFLDCILSLSEFELVAACEYNTMHIYWYLMQCHEQYWAP